MGERGRAVDRVGVRLRDIADASECAIREFSDGDILAVRQRLAAIRDEINRAMPVLKGRGY